MPNPEDIQRSAIDARSLAQSQASHPEPAAQFIIQPRPRFAETAFGFQWGNRAYTTTIRHAASPVDVANALSALSNEILRGGVASGNTFYDRLKTEQRELAGRLQKLGDFIDDGDVGSLSGIQLDALVRQRGAMAEYLGILEFRIENIEHETGQTSAAEIERRPVHEGLEAEPEVREIGAADPVRDGPIPFDA